MKTKIALLLVLILCVSVFLPACGKKDTDNKLSFAEIFNASYDDSDADYSWKVYTKAEIASELTGMTMDGYQGDFLFFRNYYATEGETKVAVLNTETGEIVLTLKQEEADAKVTYNVVAVSANYDSFLQVTKTDMTDEENPVYTYTIYTPNGEEITSKTSKTGFGISVSYLGYTMDREGKLYSINNKIYELKDGVATFVMDEGIAGVPSVFTNDYYGTRYTTETNYYAFNGDNVFVYDLEFNLVAYYSIPSECEVWCRGLLANGNVVIQYVKELPEDAIEYDFYEDGTKYLLTTIIFDIADESTKEMEFDYAIEAVVDASNSDVDGIFVEGKLTNVARVYPIVDQSVDYNDDTYLNLDNDLGVINEMDKVITAQSDLPMLIANNRFRVYNKANQSFLLNEKGEVIGEITGANYNYELGLFEKNGKYYDLDLKLVFDSNEIQYNYYTGTSYYTVYTDTKLVDDEYVTTYYLLNGVNMTKLDIPKNATNLNFYDKYFYYTYSVEGSDGSYKRYTAYRNINGELIHTVELTADSYYTHSVKTYGDVVIIVLQTRDSNYNYSYKYYIGK